MLRFNRLVLTVLAVLLAGPTILRAEVGRRVPVEEERAEGSARGTDAPLVIPAALRPRLELAAAFTTPTAGPLELSIEQAAVLALQNNRDLQVQQLNPVIAGTFEQLERGVFDPELFAELTWVKERGSETDRATGTRFNVEGRDTDASVGLRQTFPTGTAVAATVEQRRSISDRAPEQQAARVGLSVTQALLRGLGPAVNLVNVRQAGLEARASLYELRGFTEVLIADTETAYWNYVLAREEIAIFERSLGVAQQQRDEIELKIEVGILPEIEVAAARAEVARREQALIDARSLLENTRLRLLRFINPGSSGPYERQIEPLSEPRLETEPLTDLADRLDLAERFRPDLNEARLRLQQNRLETIATRNGLLPRLDLFIALGKTGFADTFANAFRDLDGNTYDFRVGVTLNHALGNRAAAARDRAALASRQQGVAAVDNLRDLVQLDVRLAVNEVERARLQIAASKTTRSLQEQTLSAEEERFDVGASTALLVTQAQRDLLASHIGEVEAIIGYRIALVRLHLAEGSLLERRGILLGGTI